MIVAVVGLYPTVIGWIPAASRPISRNAAHPPRDLPRAAWPPIESDEMTLAGGRLGPRRRPVAFRPIRLTNTLAAYGM